MDWWRCYHGMPTDTKFALIAKAAKARRGDVAAIWLFCLDYASQNQRRRGSISGLDAEEIAVAYDYKTEYVKRILSALAERGMCGPDGDLPAWHLRQPKREDFSSERVKEFRERRKRTETHCNALKRIETHDVCMKRNETPEREIEREKEEREEKETPTPSVPPFESKPSWALDETFAPFVVAYLRAKPNVLEEEFTESHRPWRQMQFPDKLRAVDGVNRRIEYGIWDDPQYVPSPTRYLQREWKREVVKPKRNGNGDQSGEYKSTTVII